MHGDTYLTVLSLLNFWKALLAKSLSLNWIALISSTAPLPYSWLWQKVKGPALDALAFNSQERLLHPASSESVDQNKFSLLNRVASGSSGKCNLLWNLFLHSRLEAKCSSLLHLSNGPSQGTGWLRIIVAWMVQETLTAVILTAEVGLMSVNYSG